MTAQYDAQFKNIWASRMLWLVAVRSGMTHGHIDDICRFTDHKDARAHQKSNKRDINAAASRKTGSG